MTYIKKTVYFSLNFFYWCRKPVKIKIKRTQTLCCFTYLKLYKCSYFYWLILGCFIFIAQQPLLTFKSRFTRKCQNKLFVLLCSLHPHEFNSTTQCVKAASNPAVNYFLCVCHSGGAEQEQSVCQRVLWGRQRVCRHREGGAELPVHRGEFWLGVIHRHAIRRCLVFWTSCCSLRRAVSPTRGQCVAATGRPTETTVSSTETLVSPDWRSKWPTTDTAGVRVTAAHTKNIIITVPAFKVVFKFPTMLRFSLIFHSKPQRSNP